MAINLNTQYPGRTAGTNTNYPFGQGRNVTTQGDGTGTPYEAAWFNDVQGFLQALLQGASLTPSGTPDNATTSQYLQALSALYIRANRLGTATGNIPQIGTPGTTAAGGRSSVVVRAGANTNGFFRVFSDGLRIQWRTAISIRRESRFTWIFPVAFTNASSIFTVCNRTSGEQTFNRVLPMDTATTTRAAISNIDSGFSATGVSIAVGF